MGGPAGNVTSCMEIIFQPFKDLHLSNPQRTEHIVTAISLLSLIADLSTAGMIEKAAFQTTFCEAMYQLRVPNLQEFVVVSRTSSCSVRLEQTSKNSKLIHFVQSCFPDRHATKIELLDYYLTKFSVSSSTTFPPPPSKHPPVSTLPTPSTSPPKASLLATASSSKASTTSKTSTTTSSQRVVIEIDSDTYSSDSDVVCLTPIVKKKTPPKSKVTPIKAKPSAPSSPVKAKPAVQTSPAKPYSLSSPQSSQDIKPSLAALLDPLLPTPAAVIAKMSKQIPRDFSSLAVDAPKMRVPKRMAENSKQSSHGRTITPGIINAEKKFSTIKLELARVYIAHAMIRREMYILDTWKGCRMSSFLAEGVRGYRYLLKSEDGELPADLQTWERREQAVMESVM